MGKDAPPRARADRPLDPAKAGAAAAAGEVAPRGKALEPGVAQALANLSPAEAMQVLDVLEKALKRRKIQLWGYLLAGVVLVLGTIGALYYYGASEAETFVGWAFLVPLGLVGVVLFTFGKWSERYRTPLEQRFEDEQRQKKA